ncbi:exosortase family protein XrtF [Nonlabens ponticola]|uniref:Exosortase family protein XrtF n=1 Tax=Nonlabens ponticola TaxID=2496866 RepID=A0A3S9MU95_9FLAO|nr:exosortase family protein XrtF [Nonlabens ponticola]AZQ42745.1 exosortase family protein XrtF [Nonlabens ponticola]
MSILRPYYPVFKFVITFGAIYTVLSLIYYVYLQQDYSGVLFPDPVTAQVAYQTQQLLILFGYDAVIANSPFDPSVLMYIDEQIVYRVIEGCNAISVMVLFAAFVIAFAKAWKPTALYLLIGIAFLYIVNVARLVILGIVYKDYPQYQDFAHDIGFPTVIYGAVILLWLYWLKKPNVS